MTHVKLGRERKVYICKLAGEALLCNVGGMYFILRQSSSALFPSSLSLRAGQLPEPGIVVRLSQPQEGVSARSGARGVWMAPAPLVTEDG